MKKWIDFFNKHRHKVNKYWITVIVFLAVTFSISDNTFLDGFRYESKIKSLRKEVETLKAENDKKRQQLKALTGDKESLEKFAREQFHMTKANEDIFLIGN